MVALYCGGSGLKRKNPLTSGAKSGDRSQDLGQKLGKPVEAAARMLMPQWFWSVDGLSENPRVTGSSPVPGIFFMR